MKKPQENEETGKEAEAAMTPVLSFEEYLEDLKMELQRETVALTEDNVFDYAEVAA